MQSIPRIGDRVRLDRSRYGRAPDGKPDRMGTVVWVSSGNTFYGPHRMATEHATDQGAHKVRVLWDDGCEFDVLHTMII